MRKICVLMLVCLLAVSALADIRGIHWGNSEEEVKQVETATFMWAKTEPSFIDVKTKIDSTVLVYTDTMFDCRTNVSYYFWEDQMYEVSLIIHLSDLIDDDRSALKKAIFNSLAEKYGKSARILTAELWDTEQLKIRYAPLADACIITYTHKAISNSKDKAIAKLKEEKLNKVINQDDLNKL